MNLIIWGGGFIVAILSVIAIYYHVLLYRQKQKRQQSEKELESVLSERRQKNVNSIIIIAKAILDDQVSHTEASIRISALMQSLALDEESLEALSVFSQLAEATQHIPILERWKALSRKEKAAYDREREGIEAKFSEFVLLAAKKIVYEKIVLTPK